MKTHKVLLEKLLDANPRTGLIHFNRKRMALIPTESLGALRRDLLVTLGKERTKAIFLRYGWTAGMNAAASVKKEFSWKAMEDLILTGTSLHTLAGVVMVEPQQLEVTDDHFYMRGVWHHSFEYEEHVKHDGFSDESVCWMLLGFIKGYLTSVYGKDLVVYEEQCKGKKDMQCIFVACTPQQCPSKYLQEMRYFKKQNLASEFDSMYNELEQARHTIGRADQLIQKLAHVIVSENGVYALLNVLQEELGLSVILEKQAIRKPFETCFLDEDDQKAYEQYCEGSPVNAYQTLQSFPIKVGQVTYGKLIIIAKGKIDPVLSELAERTIPLLACFFNAHYKLAQTVWQKKVDLFEQLKDPQIDLSHTMIETNVLDIKPSNPNRVITIESDIADVNDLYMTVSHYISTDVFVHEQILVAIVCDKDQQIEKKVNGLLEQLQQTYPKNKLYIGVGRYSTNLKSLVASYEEAHYLSQFVKICSKEQTKIAFYERLQHVLIFLKTADISQMQVYYQSILGDLIAFDEKQDAQLLYTLEVFFEQNGNINRTAQLLNLSIPGLRYRLEKIENLIDGDLKTGNGRFQCQLALQFYYAVKSI